MASHNPRSRHQGAIAAARYYTYVEFSFRSWLGNPSGRNLTANSSNKEDRKVFGEGAMKVFIFDLLAYGEQLDHLKIGSELPYPLSNRYFKADVAVRTYAEHLDAWEEMDRLGYDGVGFNEHHCSPYGLMNSPNLMAAAAAQRTKRLKLLIYGNLLPLHEPLRLAEELAMLDCLSNAG